MTWQPPEGFEDAPISAAVDVNDDRAATEAEAREAATLLGWEFQGNDGVGDGIYLLMPPTPFVQAFLREGDFELTLTFTDAVRITIRAEMP